MIKDTSNYARQEMEIKIKDLIIKELMQVVTEQKVKVPGHILGMLAKLYASDMEKENGKKEKK